MTKQLAFYFDASACTGCKACVVACKDRSNLPVGVNWRRVYHYEGGEWGTDPNNKDLMVPKNLFVTATSVACMHCQVPVCANVCPTGAITKDDNGIVTINQDQCIGCRYCQWACPYGAPQFNDEAGVMTKCDFCQDLQAEGQNPACVDACVMRVLDYGELGELRVKHGSEAAVEPLPPADITYPSVVITPHKDSQASGKGTGKILTLEEV